MSDPLRESLSLRVTSPFRMLNAWSMLSVKVSLCMRSSSEASAAYCAASPRRSCHSTPISPIHAS